MNAEQESVAQRLLDESVIFRQQLAEVKAYRSLGIFSLHHELQMLLYASVLLFTAGAGILIYENIDTIGHTAILVLLLLLCAGSYYFCFKKSTGFHREEVDFDHPAYQYLVLLATILGTTFIGYWQYQYAPFGSYHEVPTLLSAALAFASAYYFDNRSALTIGTTALAAAVGITATPQTVLDNDFLGHPALLFSGIVLGILLVGWTEYSQRTALKKHFALVFLTFAQHLLGICCVAGLIEGFWPVYAIVLAAETFYFYKKSHAIDALSLFVFALVYAYIGWNILMFKAIDFIGLNFFSELLILAAPLYFIGSITLFVFAIKRFNKKNDDRLR